MRDSTEDARDRTELPFFQSLNRGPDSIWRSAEDVNFADISYPASGHDVYFDVEDQSFWFGHRNDVILDTYAKLRAPHAEIPFFDIGGGNGAVARCLQDAGYATCLVEPGLDGARNALRRGVRNVVCSVWEKLSPASDCFDVGLFDVLEHVEKPVDLLRSIGARMAPGCYILLTVPAYGWLWSHEDVFVQHYRRYTRTRLARELDAAGFDVVRDSYFFLILPPAIALMRSLPYRLGLAEGQPSSTDAKGDHKARSGALALLLNAERRMLRRNWRLPFGSSVLCVARKRLTG